MSTKKCSAENCDLDAWKNDNKCVLHCQKNDYQSDRYDGTLNEFYSEFKKYIVHTLKRNGTSKQDIHEKIITGKINAENLEKNDLKESYIHIHNIVFPYRAGRDIFDYLKVLNLFGEIHFDNCTFYTTSLKLPYSQVFFQECKFINGWFLYDYKLLENADSVIYQSCCFKDDISMENFDDNDYEKSFRILSLITLVDLIKAYN